MADLPRTGTDETDDSIDGFPRMTESLDVLLALASSYDDAPDDLPREESAGFGALLERCQELGEEVQAEMAAIEKEMAEQADDEAYWGRLYYAMDHRAEDWRDACSEGESKAEREDADDENQEELGIERVLAKRQVHNVVYYQVRWREHRAVTWERADDIMAARNLLTAFDRHLRSGAGKQPPGPGGSTKMSRRERRERREAKLAGAVEMEGGALSPPRAAPVRAPVPVCAPAPVRAPQASNSYDEAAVRQLIAQLDKSLLDADKNCTGAAPVKDWPAASMTAFTAVYNEIVATFADRANGYLAKYHAEPGAESLADIQPGDAVPSYFANTGGESVWRRKMLSILGLRNLVTYGRAVFREMKAKRFVGNPAQYNGDEGPHKMKRVTGSVVDLDTTVLRCSDRLTMNAINEWNLRTGQPTHSNTRDFADSQQARDIAATAATTLLEKFNSDFKFTKAQAAERRTDPDAMDRADIPMACHNTDRGRWPLWRYRNCGVDSYHVNVPSLDDVNGALLRAPLQCLKGYLTAKACGEVDAFFEDCVVDSCFNMKWKAIEEFNAQYARRGTIRQLLEEVQHAHQVEFARIMDEDDDDNTQEVAAMLRHLRGKKGMASTGALRIITEADVRKWIADPGAEL
eukprot:TRINITY_DN2843_c0_g2_i1.p1 TRINITY_DN2843_c0_g2~~TRINITY_DN2843_c0_g2_i1.p1  ORF type:complete len:633 (+),score=236.37 TRINITY_DN2843_c0_g2_i1:46-1944(+)